MDLNIGYLSQRSNTHTAHTHTHSAHSLTLGWALDGVLGLWVPDVARVCVAGAGAAMYAMRNVENDLLHHYNNLIMLS